MACIVGRGQLWTTVYGPDLENRIAALEVLDFVSHVALTDSLGLLEYHRRSRMMKPHITSRKTSPTRSIIIDAAVCTFEQAKILDWINSRCWIEMCVGLSSTQMCYRISGRSANRSFDSQTALEVPELNDPN